MVPLSEFWRRDSGISSVEYALLLALIAGGIIFAVDGLGDAVEIEFRDKAKCLRDTTSVYLDPACGD